MAVPAVLLLAVVPVLAGDEPAWGGDVSSLLDGVASVPAPGVPGTLVAFGEQAFPILLDKQGETVLAGARVGAGRVAAFGHGGLTGSSDGDAARLRLNIARWLLGDHRRATVFGVDAAAIEALRADGVEIDMLDRLPKELDEVGLIFGTVENLVRDRGLTVDQIRQWLNAGGGLLAADTAWGYLQLKHAETIDALPCNRLMMPEGLAWTNTLRDAPDGVAYGVPDGDARIPPTTAHALLAAKLLCDGEGGLDQETSAAAVATVSAAIDAVSDLGPLEQLLDREAGRADIEAAFAGMDKHPLDPKTQPLACLLLDLASKRWSTSDAGEIRAHPSAAAFPGSVPGDADRGRADLTLETSLFGWRSTGLYAPPGEVVTLEFDAGRVGRGIAVQIGAWRDPQQFPKRVRMRRVLRRWSVDDTTIRVASPVGGPIYIDLPGDLAFGSLTVAVTGAVRAPHFRLGVTSEQDWREAIRNAPAPWGELESDEVALTLPSDTMRNLDDPAALMRHWNRIHEAMQELEPRQASHWADRQFRYVADRRLSWGYMYCPADGPIVVPMSAAHEATDLAFITRAEEKPTMWGWYHEMGHSHQDPMWTFSGLGEVTVNIFTVYALDRVLGVDPNDDTRARMGPRESWKRYEAFKASDEKFPGDAFTGLACYALLWQAFGWEPFRDVFAEYRGLPADQQPRDDQARRDQWLVRMSRAVERDLGPYFESWRIGASEEAEHEVADLPAWMPEPPEPD